jgi:Short C-terminal domain
MPRRAGGQVSELERLGSLRDRGVLTQDEFETEKAALLARRRRPVEA